MQYIDDFSASVRYAFDLSHLSDGWITPFGRAVERVPFHIAVWKPGPRTTSIYELALHAFNYLDRLTRLLSGEKPVSFDDWPKKSAPTKADWDELKKSVTSVESRAREALANICPETLAQAPARGKHPLYQSVLDIAVHNAYHAGQVNKMVQLYKDRT